MKPLGERITQGKWRKNHYSQFTVESDKLGVATTGGSSSNIEDYTEQQIANADLIIIAGNLAHRFPNVEEWEAALQQYFKDK